MTAWDRPAARPCDSCAWRRGRVCTIRAGRKRGTTGCPLPADRGATCPPRLWTARDETLVVELQAVSAISACAEVQSDAPDRGSIGNERKFSKQITRQMRRLGVHIGPAPWD